MLKEVIAGMIMLILIYLVVNNGTKTTQIISGLGSQVTTLTKTLQGR